MARTITLKNPERFKDPANLTWERYVALQARERERYLAERASIPADALAYRTVSPRYLERAVDQFANNYYSELSATHYIATAAANAPFDELKKCCLFQVADEQRHLEMDREVIERAQDESLQLFVEVARGGERREWWEGFLASYYKIALPLGLRPSSLPV